MNGSSESIDFETNLAIIYLDDDAKLSTPCVPLQRPSVLFNGVIKDFREQSIVFL